MRDTRGQAPRFPTSTFGKLQEHRHEQILFLVPSTVDFLPPSVAMRPAFAYRTSNARPLPFAPRTSIPPVLGRQIVDAISS